MSPPGLMPLSFPVSLLRSILFDRNGRTSSPLPCWMLSKPDAIVCGKIGITRHLRGDDMLRVGVEAHHPDIEILTVIQQFHCRRLGGSFAFVRLALSDVPD